MSWYEYVIYGLSILAVIGQGILAVIALSYLPGCAFLRASIERRALLWMFAVALTCTLGSLFLSDIAGIEPCTLCWYQRIAMYPVAALTGVALWRRDAGVAWYVLPFCIVGGAVAAWHYGEHVWTVMHPADPTVPCSFDGISCAVPPYWHFGYVSVPLMALTGFALNAVGCLWLLRRKA